jgi:hypothetical protein
LAYRHCVLGRCPGSDITSIASAGHPLRPERSALHLEWSGRPHSAATSTSRFAPYRCRGDDRRSTSEGSPMTGEIAPRSLSALSAHVRSTPCRRIVP